MNEARLWQEAREKAKKSEKAILRADADLASGKFPVRCKMYDVLTYAQ